MTTPTIEPWPLLRTENLGDFRIFRIRRDWRRSPRTGREHDFFVLNAPDWVNVIALTPDREVVLVEQFRHGTATVDLEVPGGVMDAEDADPVATAVRELREETGYVGQHARLLGGVAANPAFLSNTCHTVLVENCVPVGEREFDPGEDIATRLVPASDLPRLVAEGRFRHSLVVAAIYHFELHERGLKKI
jgi:8-oxo-dGTP pyrophosphatase MutT (NUDIX family)